MNQELSAEKIKEFCEAWGVEKIETAWGLRDARGHFYYTHFNSMESAKALWYEAKERDGKCDLIPDVYSSEYPPLTLELLLGVCRNNEVCYELAGWINSRAEVWAVNNLRDICAGEDRDPLTALLKAMAAFKNVEVEG